MLSKHRLLIKYPNPDSSEDSRAADVVKLKQLRVEENKIELNMEKSEVRKAFNITMNIYEHSQYSN